MIKCTSTLLTFLCLSLTLLANNGDENSPSSAIKLCSGETMSWGEYLELRACMRAEELPEVESFKPFSVAEMNNTAGAWSSVISMPLVAAAAAQLPDGKVLCWSARDKFAFGGNQGRTWTSIFDPSNNTANEALIQNTSHDMFCPGVNTLADGRILVTGGSSSDKTSIYDPSFNTWTTGDQLNISRGYHANAYLAGGHSFTIGGSWSGGQGNKHAEIWTEKSGWWEVPGLPVDAIIEGLQSSQPTFQDDYFPWLWQAPNGKIFHAGPNQRMHWIDAQGVGSYTFAGNRDNDQFASSGTTVMFDIGKILKTGGSNTFEDGTDASNNCYVIDFNQDNVVVNNIPDMNFERIYHNSVVLPTGEIMVVGGIPKANVFSDNNSALVPEMYNPTTNSWTNLAQMATPRNYHSVALLLQDGRIFLAGGGLCGGCSTNHANAEIYSPPYLFNSNGNLASRPNLSNVPASSNFSSNITVNASNGIGSFALVSMAAVTHSTNNNQRRIPLTFNNLGSGQYSLAIPNRFIVPPGNYMLFAMNSNGTPSVAKIINIGDDINDCVPQTNPDLGGTGLTGTYFNNSNLTSEALERLDATIDFDWGNTSPDNSIDANTFSVRWEGSIRVPREGAYTFYTTVDDGVRLWVDDVLMVDRWTDSGATEDIGFIYLDAGILYNIKMEYYENSGEAVAELRWSGPGINKEIIPTGNLFPANDPCGGANAPTVTNISSQDSDCNQNNGSITLTFTDNPNRTGIEFSIDGGNSWPGNYNVPDNSGSLTISNLSPDNYDLWVRWGNNDCPINLNDATINEVGCSGGGGDCADIAISTTNSTIQIAGVDGAPITSIQIFTSAWQNFYSCFADCDSPNATIPAPAGDYFVYVKYYEANYTQICAVDGTYTVGGGGGGNPCNGQGGDLDGDGVCGNQDCDDTNPNVPATIGSSCNDGNPNTFNDVIQSDGCTCEGTPGSGNDPDCATINIDTDNGEIVVSGLIDAPVVSVQVFTESWQSVYSCFDDCSQPTETIAVNNGNYRIFVKFYDNAYQLICQESGIYTVSGGSGGGNPCDNQGGDADGDGVCANQDCDDNNASVPAPIGSSCNDGNASTQNDVIQSDGCTCAGTPVGSGDCGDIVITASNGAIQIEGLDAAPITSVQIFTTSWATQYSCFADCPSPTATVSVPNGSYYVFVKFYSSSYQLICDVDGTYTVSGSGGGSPCANDGGDADGDGLCANEDCNDNDATLPAPVGSSCDDGDFSTTNDVIQSDGCSCAGTPTSGGGACNDVTIATNNGQISVSGLDAGPIASVQIFQAPTWFTILQCFADCDTPVQTVDVSAGTYYVFVKFYETNYSLICEISETVTVGSALVGDTNFNTTHSPLEVLRLEKERQRQTSNFSVFPNPTHQELTLNLENYLGNSVRVEIYDALGQVQRILPFSIVTQRHQTIDLYDLPSGNYWIRVQGDRKASEVLPFLKF